MGIGKDYDLIGARIEKAKVWVLFFSTLTITSFIGWVIFRVMEKSPPGILIPVVFVLAIITIFFILRYLYYYYSIREYLGRPKSNSLFRRYLDSFGWKK